MYAQDIQQVQAYSQLGGTRYVASLSDNSLWWYSQGSPWKPISKDSLPAHPVKFLDAYVKVSIGSLSTRLAAVLNDNSIWWFANGEPWTQISTQGLPQPAVIKDFKTYGKVNTFGTTETRFVTLLDDNSIWWFADGEKWKQVRTKGMPEQLAIKTIRTYQKKEMMGSETRYFALMEDNSIWWFADGEKWKSFEQKGLPKGQDMLQIEVYMKGGSGISNMQEGRLLVRLADQSIWWAAAKGNSWKQLENKGLPAGYRIRTMKVYEKANVLASDTRIIVLLENNTLWWYADGTRWTPVPMNGLPKG